MATSAAAGRFIPTGVGNTRGSKGEPSGFSVHPHGRGEHGVVGGSFCHHSGSSPRAWGTPMVFKTTPTAQRFIPTGVGNTHKPRTAPGSAAVHPHGRGEHHDAKTAKGFADGSSPRAWGTRHLAGGTGYHFRFIPTGVGNTMIFLMTGVPGAVHPHGRGEHHPATW